MSGFEDVHVHRFTDDGRYLICFSRNQHDLVVYRFKGFGAADESAADEPGRAAGPAPPSAGEAENEGARIRGASGGAASAPSARGGEPRVAQPATTRDRYFDLLYTRPLTVDADLLARDFAVTILDGAYLLVASSTPAEAPPPRDRGAGERTAADAAAEPGRTRDAAGAAATAAGGGGGGGGASPSGPAAPTHEVGAAAASARASGAAAVARARAEVEADTVARRGAGRPNATTTLPGSPTMDTVALHLVRLRDGRVCDRRVYRDDYVRLRRAAAVSVFAETASSCLVSVLSLRWQAFRVLRVSLAPPAPADGAAQPAATSEQAGSDPSRASVRGNAKAVDEEDLVASFADARTPVGSACAPDDDAPLAAQDRAEREWRLAARADARLFCSGDDDVSDDAFALTPSEPASGDDDARLLEDDAGRTRGGGRAPGASGERARRASAVTRARGPGVGGWSDPESHMYAGIKQKLMTRVLLEARRRDEAAAEAEAREKAEADAAGACVPPRDDPYDPSSSLSSRRGVKRDAASAFVPSVSAPPTESERLAETYSRARRRSSSGKAFPAPKAPPPRATRRGAFVSAFFSRYWSYAEWMVLWHVQLLDERRALLRFGTAEDVLAWGTRRSRAEAGAHPGSERCPESVLVAVMDWVDGTVAHVGDAAGTGGGLLGVPNAPERSGLSKEVTEGGVPGEPAPPQAEGSVWQRLAAGAGGVGGRAPGGVGVGVGVGDGDGGVAKPVSSQRFVSSNPNPAGLEPGFRWPARPSSQGHWSPSPYFDTRLFRYDERAAAPDERPRPAPDVSLRFSAAPRRVRRVENARGASSRNAALRGAFEEPEEPERGRSEERRAPESAPTKGETEARRMARGARFAFSPSRVVATGARARVKRTITHVFHPVYPFAMSVSQAFMQPQVVSFHLRWDGAAE